MNASNSPFLCHIYTFPPLYGPSLSLKHTLSYIALGIDICAMLDQQRGSCGVAFVSTPI